MNGMHVIYVPPSVLKNSPAMWLQMVTKHRGMSQMNHNFDKETKLNFVIRMMVEKGNKDLCTQA